MKNIEKTIFYQDDNGIQLIVTKDGGKWFRAREICEILELPTSFVFSHIPTYEYQRIQAGFIGTLQLCLTEAGVYSLAFACPLYMVPTAKRFLRWFARSVMPMADLISEEVRRGDGDEKETGEAEESQEAH